jgi:amino acid transporter
MMSITVNYCIQSVKIQIAESFAVYPFISIFEVAVGSRAGAVGMTVPVVILSFAAAVNSVAAASRETWAFSRDGGLPMSKWWARVQEIGKTPVPLAATILANWFTVFAALLNLAGSEVYNTIISLATGAVCGSYIISIGSLILRRLSGKPLPRSRFTLGRAGLPLNIIAFFYNIQLVIFSYFPLFSPVTA